MHHLGPHRAHARSLERERETRRINFHPATRSRGSRVSAACTPQWLTLWLRAPRGLFPLSLWKEGGRRDPLLVISARARVEAPHRPGARHTTYQSCSDIHLRDAQSRSGRTVRSRRHLWPSTLSTATVVLASGTIISAARFALDYLTFDLSYSIKRAMTGMRLDKIIIH